MTATIFGKNNICHSTVQSDTTEDMGFMNHAADSCQGGQDVLPSLFGVAILHISIQSIFTYRPAVNTTELYLTGGN